MTEAREVVKAFNVAGEVIDIRRYGSGNMNDTFLVTFGPLHANKVILQRINRYVFKQPALIMVNIRTFLDYVRAYQESSCGSGRRWELPEIRTTKDGTDYYEDVEGGFWRMLSFIDGARTFDTVQNTHHAWEVGYALGHFHAVTSGLPPEKLHDTLVGFHITPRYLAHYSAVLAQNTFKMTPEVQYGLNFVAERQAWVSILEDAVANKELVLRPIHGDPKVNNILIDEVNGQAVSIVDLDTMKPGLVHYDIGDCMRSCCNPLGEETTDFDGVRFETDLCQAILQGYLSMAQRFLTAKDYDYIYDSIRLIAFELGLRFFTDHLEGNVYFKAKHPEHNLHRALVQFRLTERIEAQARNIQTIIDDLRVQ